MSDILIKNMEMPKDDEHGFILVFTKGLVVDFTNNKVIKAIPVPKHGDLIPYTPTKNAIIKVVGRDNPLWSDIMDEVDKIPVVLEAST